MQDFLGHVRSSRASRGPAKGQPVSPAPAKTILVHVDRGAERIVLPMTAEQIRVVEQAVTTPVRRLAVALAAVHAARATAIRELALDDIDLPSRRITPAGQRQRLGELTRDALLGWLEYRRATCPSTANR